MQGQNNSAVFYISIHAPTRGATARDGEVNTYAGFQSTLPRGERPYIVNDLLQSKHFNPRSHEGSDIINFASNNLSTNFNPRSHEGSDIFSCIPGHYHVGFQSTLPRGERREDLGTDAATVGISIHAPTRGATCPSRQCHRSTGHFNPRSHEGSDAVFLSDNPVDFNFNPRSHEGSDVAPVQPAPTEEISIHAPTRGATFWKASKTSGQMHFNPRSHEGSDRQAARLSLRAAQFQSTLPRGERQAEILSKAIHWIFQSTLPRGERRTGNAGCSPLVDFNPRSHEGSDVQGAGRNDNNVGISIHAPTRGATAVYHTRDIGLTDFNPRSHEGSDRTACILESFQTISIHAPTRGATGHPGYNFSCHQHFNPRSHEGSDIQFMCIRNFLCAFQSTLPRGERRDSATVWRYVCYFNPRSHEGSDAS